jgi:hypothetical protein
MWDRTCEMSIVPFESHGGVGPTFHCDFIFIFSIHSYSCRPPSPHRPWPPVHARPLAGFLRTLRASPCARVGTCFLLSNAPGEFTRARSWCPERWGLRWRPSLVPAAGIRSVLAAVGRIRGDGRPRRPCSPRWSTCSRSSFVAWASPHP